MWFNSACQRPISFNELIQVIELWLSYVFHNHLHFVKQCKVLEIGYWHSHRHRHKHMTRSKYIYLCSPQNPYFPSIRNSLLLHSLCFDIIWIYLILLIKFTMWRRIYVYIELQTDHMLCMIMANRNWWSCLSLHQTCTKPHLFYEYWNVSDFKVFISFRSQFQQQKIRRTEKKRRTQTQSHQSKKRMSEREKNTMLSLDRMDWNRVHALILLLLVLLWVVSYQVSLNSLGLIENDYDLEFVQLDKSINEQESKIKRWINHWNVTKQIQFFSSAVLHLE